MHLARHAAMIVATRFGRTPVIVNIRKFFAAFRAELPSLAIDVIGIAGAAAIVRGAALIYSPAAWIIGGAMAVTACHLIARNGPPGNPVPPAANTSPRQ
jgi:hypothetical protein